MPTMRRAITATAFSFALVLGVAACGDDDGSGGTDTTCPPFVEDAGNEPLVDGDNPGIPGAEGGPAEDPDDISAAGGAPEVTVTTVDGDGIGAAGAIDPGC
ncbi:hypothetical protein [Rhabdothermincola salaria]|uniref:hypothetical protein n=1 Tax=Rhabdothermincola salaria TaxID=2903142 RepID=UPI001E5C0727|nr:hypothetical protein [Rhabdothermincola salaria]MCD9625164.1 hypothetical protein [Rhabdothermincola salaria]